MLICLSEFYEFYKLCCFREVVLVIEVNVGYSLDNL